MPVRLAASFGAVLGAALIILIGPVRAQDPDSTETVERLHMLIPGGAGGGWDGTARGVGFALRESGLAESVSFENMSGGGGGRAIAYMIETADRRHETLMVNSIPILLRSLRGTFTQSFRDLTPVASVIGDYGAFVVTADSEILSFHDAVDRFLADRRSVKVAGGSVRGSMDHLVAALTFRAAGGNPADLIYVFYDGGGKAMAGLLSGETELLVTGVSEAMEQFRAGQVRILAVSAPERVPEIPGVPTLIELGIDVEFVNWRGFFGPPGLDSEAAGRWHEMFERMYATDAWEAVRARNGWTNMFHGGADFVRYLEDQENMLRSVLVELQMLPE